MDFSLKIHSNENEAVIQGCYNCRWLTVIYNTRLLFTGQSKVADVCFTCIGQAFLTALSFLLLKLKLMHEYFMFWRNRVSVLEILIEIASVVRGSKRIWKKINSNQRSNSIQFSSEARGRGAELNWIWSEVWIYFLSRWVCFRGQQRQFILNIMSRLKL